MLAGLDSSKPSHSLGLVGVTSLLDLDRVRRVVVHLLNAPQSQLLVGHGWPSLCQGADKALEDEAAVARVSAVEAEDELVEIGVQVLVAHRPLVSSEQPAFQERSHSVNVGVDKVRTRSSL